MKRLILLCSAFALTACIEGVFDPIEIADGTKGASASQTVNGSIRVGNDVTVTSGTFRTVNGSATVGNGSVVPGIATVNGSIRIGMDSRTGALATVNGGVTLGEGSVAEGDVESVNGPIVLADGARVEGSARAVNGPLRLDSAHVTGDIQNHNGGMELRGMTVVEGDLAVRRSQGINITMDEIPRVVIGPDVTVMGRLIFERDVQLIIHRGAQVGDIQGATPEWIEPELKDEVESGEV
jgi:hypothetical protein